MLDRPQTPLPLHTHYTELFMTRDALMYRVNTTLVETCSVTGILQKYVVSDEALII